MMESCGIFKWAAQLSWSSVWMKELCLHKPSWHYYTATDREWLWRHFQKSKLPYMLLYTLLYKLLSCKTGGWNDVVCSYEHNINNIVQMFFFIFLIVLCLGTFLLCLKHHQRWHHSEFLSVCYLIISSWCFCFPCNKVLNCFGTTLLLEIGASFPVCFQPNTQFSLVEGTSQFAEGAYDSAFWREKLKHSLKLWNTASCSVFHSYFLCVYVLQLIATNMTVFGSM